MSRKQKIKQVVVGAALVTLGIISAAITNDSTAAVMIIPAGLGVMFTRDEVVM